MFQGARGMEFMRRLVKALGYDGRPVERIVIDVKVGSLVKVHVVEHVANGDAFLEVFDEVKAADLVQVERVANVEVLPDAEAVVVATPLSEHQVAAVRAQLGAMMEAAVPTAQSVVALPKGPRPWQPEEGTPGTPVGDGCGTLQVEGPAGPINVAGLCLAVWKHAEGAAMFWDAAPTDPLPAELVGRKNMMALMDGRVYPVQVLTQNRVRSAGPPVKGGAA